MRYYARHEGRRWEVIEVESAQIVATFQEHKDFDAEKQAKSFAAKLEVSTPMYSAVYENEFWYVMKGDVGAVAVLDPEHVPDAKERAEALVKELTPKVHPVFKSPWVVGDRVITNPKGGFFLLREVGGIDGLKEGDLLKYVVDLHNRSLGK